MSLIHIHPRHLTHRTGRRRSVANRQPGRWSAPRIARRAGVAAVLACIGWMGAATGTGWLASLVQPVQAQSQAASPTKAATRAYRVPKTPWGDPDLQGLWSNATTTPLERPSQLAGKEVLTDAERAEFDARRAAAVDGRPRAGDTGAYNSFWLDPGTASKQTSLVVDPPDGRMPALTADAKQRDAALAKIRARTAESWTEFSLYERCITRGMPGVMMPGFYNHNYQIFQTKDYVAILVEMIHDARIIPLDGRAHLPAKVRQWNGDSRARWEGSTLVVETTNLLDIHERRPSLAVFGSSKDLKMVERFTRTDENAIDYRFTLTDPAVYTKPWTASVPMYKIDQPIFEYACHEGNHAIPNMLRGARVSDKLAAEGSKP